MAVSLNFGGTLAMESEIFARRAVMLRHASARLFQVSPAINRTSDTAAIKRLSNDLARIAEADPAGPAKYASYRLWLWRNIHRAARLGLHCSGTRRIFDIGAGPGYFIAVGRALGHYCQGIDVPEDLLSSLEQRVYSSLLRSLGCAGCVSRYCIEPFTPLPRSVAEYDLITAFLVCFNRHRQPDEWGVAEWQYFVEDALIRLRPGGSLVLGLNDHPERFGKLLFYDQPLLDYFQSIGRVAGGRIMITKPGAGGGSLAANGNRRSNAISAN
jgi:SAM-dependent methyltransferase